MGIPSCSLWLVLLPNTFTSSLATYRKQLWRVPSNQSGRLCASCGSSGADALPAGKYRDGQQSLSCFLVRILVMGRMC